MVLGTRPFLIIGKEKRTGWPSVDRNRGPLFFRVAKSLILDFSMKTSLLIVCAFRIVTYRVNVTS